MAHATEAESISTEWAPPVVGASPAHRPALLPRLAVGVGALGGLAYIARFDPNRAGHYPLCPFKFVTGLDCPGCGTLREIGRASCRERVYVLV